ncbi:MAG: beta-galactosidase, partial [Prevotella sp.]|nr:beta-galactosidase [Prevotella sp.]
MSTAVWAQPREIQSLNLGWEFARDSLFSDARTVDVPHDLQIEQPWVPPTAEERPDNSDVAANIKSRLSARGFKEMGAGWYRKTITPDASLKGRRLLIDFEGIMLVGDVWLNGERIGGTDYGYVGFEIDITNKLRYGQPNEIKVKASTMTEKNSRWYTGGGLFRNVSLVNTPSD